MACLSSPLLYQMELFPNRAALFFPMTISGSWHQESPRQPLGLVIFTRRTCRPPHGVILIAKIYNNKKIHSEIGTGKAHGPRIKKRGKSLLEVSPSRIIQDLLNFSSIKLSQTL